MYHAQPHLTNITCVALDTETTGLQPMVHRLVEIGAVRFRLDGCELATFQQLIDPEIPIPPEVQQVHGITDAMVRRKPTIEHVLPQFIEFLGESDTILLAHHAPFDLSFLAMALTRLGLAYPLHSLFDTLEMARRLYPIWHSHRLENVAARLKSANRAEHRALSDARLVKDVFLAMLRRTPTLTKISEFMHVSQPLTFADARVCAIEPPSGFEAISTAIAERCTITIIYEHGSPRPGPRKITPRLVLEVQGVVYMVADGYQGGCEKTFRLDRIRECWLE
jgi:DNA polymerase III epsilon subunit